MTTSGPLRRGRLEEISGALAARNTKWAAALAEVEFAAGTRHPLLYTARGLWRAEQGQHAEALDDFQRADAMSAPNPAVKSAMGVCLTSLGQFDKAVEAFDAALALQPNSANLHYRRGWALELAQELVAARQAHLRALELDPTNPEILGRLAYLASRQAAWPETEDYARRALAADPGHLAAILAIATADIEQGRLEAADQRLTALAANDTIKGQDRFLTLGLLGDLRDRQDRTDEAFNAFEAANLESRITYANVQFTDGLATSEAVSGLLSYFDRKTPQKTPFVSTHAGAGEAGHVFLLGFPRSGTTLLEQALGSHSDVVTLEEKDPMADAVRPFAPWSRNIAAIENASEQVLNECRDRYWERVRKYGADPSGKTFIDKGPIYTVKIPLIVRLFPKAQVLFAVRDPRDVVLSCFRRRFGINSTTFEFLTLDGTARFYNAVMTLADIYGRVLPVNLTQTKHEALVEDYETEVRRICTAIGLSWQDQMRDFSRRSKMGAIATVSAPQIAKGLNREGIGQWRRYAGQMAPVLPILQPWVERFGYPPQ